jgi:hypothetical protein
VSREHRRAKTDRLDTELLKRSFLGWLRGERDHCKMVEIPTTAGGRPVPLIDQAHRLMHLWRAGDEAKVDEYLDTQGLKRNALFAQLLQALIELAATGSEERSILESLSNHIASRGGISVPRQIGMAV